MENFTEEQNRIISEFLSKLETEIDVNNCVDIDSINLEDPFESIKEMIEENNGFDIEIMYYSTAMEYLTNNDNSLKSSLEIASQLGYSVESLSSEI